MWTVLIVLLLIVLLAGGLPAWPHMQRLDLGYFPSGIVGLLLLVLVILLLTGRL